jgi:hypothetical protein
VFEAGFLSALFTTFLCCDSAARYEDESMVSCNPLSNITIIITAQHAIFQCKQGIRMKYDFQMS